MLDVDNSRCADHVPRKKAVHVSKFVLLHEWVCQARFQPKQRQPLRELSV